MNFFLCFRELRLTTVMLSALVVLTACAPISRPVEQPTRADLSEFVLDDSELPTLVYVRPGAPPLSAYDRFIVDAVQVDYTDPDIKELSPEDVGRMQQSFRTKMVEELRRANYEVGTRAEANTMRISFEIQNLKAPSPVGNVSTLAAPFALSVGDVTIEAKFRDASTDRVDAVALHRAQGNRVLNPSPWSTFADVEKTFDVWARGIREAIDKAHGR